MGAYVYGITSETIKAKYNDREVTIGKADYICRHEYDFSYTKLAKAAITRANNRVDTSDFVVFGLKASPVKEGMSVYVNNHAGTWNDGSGDYGCGNPVGVLRKVGDKFVVHPK